MPRTYNNLTNYLRVILNAWYLVLKVVCGGICIELLSP
ncbi:DUF3265 domain-containing protein [Pseudoalteromonas fuliginea]|uniref:DUF3265 domain-containing protein n=1 Tax=Pseudoalteromonas fuliginea TaxID=1872678 RepID=A0ABQ6RG21_9GAMM|nr:DUF3265 domain-containing protein [Pseudoalteromonas fuliginea]KAA1166581.1 DUF3265 domain-containing protein [Pseudoalteromonas fuliginea]